MPIIDHRRVNVWIHKDVMEKVDKLLDEGGYGETKSKVIETLLNEAIDKVIKDGHSGIEPAPEQLSLDLRFHDG